MRTAQSSSPTVMPSGWWPVAFAAMPSNLRAASTVATSMRHASSTTANSCRRFTRSGFFRNAIVWSDFADELPATVPQPVFPTAETLRIQELDVANRRLILPTYLAPAFGLDRAIATIAEALAHSRLLTILGAGGSGKTRLAVEAARSLHASDARLDDIVFVSLIDCVNRQQIDEAVAAALRLPPGASITASPYLEQTLGGRRGLLILDNCEHVVDQVETSASFLLATLPALRILATSRRPLGMHGEHLFDQSPLPLPEHADAMAVVAANAGVALFVERARAARSTFRLSPSNRTGLIDLIRELEGMPLAIELAATRVRGFTIVQLLERLCASRLSVEPLTLRLDLLARVGSPPALHEARHASMRNVIDWSCRQLSVAARHLLATLSVFRGGFTAQAAALVGAKDSDVPLLLDEILAHSLLRSKAGDEVLRYEIDESVREFAATELIPGAASIVDARRHHRAWASQWAQTLPATIPLQEVRLELGNLHAACPAHCWTTSRTLRWRCCSLSSRRYGTSIFQSRCWIPAPNASVVVRRCSFAAAGNLCWRCWRSLRDTSRRLCSMRRMDGTARPLGRAPDRGRLMRSPAFAGAIRMTLQRLNLC